MPDPLGPLQTVIWCRGMVEVDPLQVMLPRPPDRAIVVQVPSSDETRLTAFFLALPFPLAGIGGGPSRTRLQGLPGRAGLGDRRDRPQAFPAATSRPPASSPLRAPCSITQSAVFTTSRLCSITTTVLPDAGEAVEDGQELADVVEVEAGCGFVEDVECLRPVPSLDQLASELDPLGLATGQGGGCLTKL